MGASWARVRDAAKLDLYGCDCYAYGLLAAGAHPPAPPPPQAPQCHEGGGGGGGGAHAHAAPAGARCGLDHPGTAVLAPALRQSYSGDGPTRPVDGRAQRRRGVQNHVHYAFFDL